MQKAFPAHFPDSGQKAAESLQRALLVLVDEVTDPNDPTLEGRKRSAEKELVDSVKPSKLAGPGNIPDRLREAYEKNLIDLQLEGLPVMRLTSSWDFWAAIARIEEKYRAQKDR